MSLITPNNFLIFVGCVLIAYGLFFLKRKSTCKNGAEKKPATEEHIYKCNASFLNCTIDNGLILVVLGIILQIFAVAYIPNDKEKSTKTEQNNTSAVDTNRSTGTVSIGNSNSMITTVTTTPCQQSTTPAKPIKILHPKQGECNESK